MSGLSPEQRSLRAKIAVHASWANTADPSARTAPGRKAFDQRFYDQVDPDRTLPEAERERRASHARSAYFSRLAYKSALVRRKMKESPQDPPSPQRSGGDDQTSSESGISS